MSEKIYRVRCVDGKIYLVHHGVSDYIGLDNQSTNEKAIIQISNYLNEQDETIQELKIRNERQYEILQAITDLMCARDWESLEKIVEGWEETDKRLRAEWGIYGDVE